MLYKKTLKLALDLKATYICASYSFIFKVGFICINKVMSPLRHRLCDILNQGNYTRRNNKIIPN